MWFGAGRVVELPEACAELGISKPLLVTDPGILNVGTMDVDASASCKERYVYVGVTANLTEANVMCDVAAFKEYGCDGVVAFGESSGMDTAKCIALMMVGQTRTLFDFENREDWHNKHNRARTETNLARRESDHQHKTVFPNLDTPFYSTTYFDVSYNRVDLYVRGS